MRHHIVHSVDTAFKIVKKTYGEKDLFHFCEVKIDGFIKPLLVERSNLKDFLNQYATDKKDVLFNVVGTDLIFYIEFIQEGC